MRSRGVGGLCLLPLALLLPGCTSGADPLPSARGSSVAVPGYEAPSGAPGFCDRLAASTAVGELPAALGMLTTADGNAAAIIDLRQAIDELEAVLSEVELENAGVTAALEDLLASVHSATRNPADDELLHRLTTRLDALGEKVQPVCGFPA